MRLHFDTALCVRAASKFSNCTKCADATEGIVRIEEQLPVFAKGTGVEASACVGACPTEAFSLSDFSVTEFFFTFLESKVRLVSRKINVPCLSVLSVEHLISLALASDEPVVLDLNDYELGTHLYQVIAERIEEANFVLSTISDKALEVNTDISETKSNIPLESDEQEDLVPDRRQFLRNTASIKGVMKQKKAFDDAVEADEMHHFEIDASMTEKIRNKHLPDKRKILFTTLKHTKKPENYEVLAEEDISFVSQKFVEESCNNCQICYRICPTGALSSDAKFSLIHFDAMLCVKCRLCHDVCEPDAIKLQPGFETKEFFDQTQRTLAAFNVRRCDECGNYFTSLEGERTCPRCTIEEEEAMFLHENAKKMKGEES